MFFENMILYINHLRGVFDVARFDGYGNARASHGGTGNQAGSTFYIKYLTTRTITIYIRHGSLSV